MSGFRKASPKQAAVKMSIYGPAGSGKTFSTLLFAEGIARIGKKRVAYVDTERGTDFYAMAVPDRQPHPEAFDFDAIYTRSLTEVIKECRALNPAEYSCIVLDSISHLWDAAIGAYTGPKTGHGGIPMHAWGNIKRPYKELMKFLIDSPFHVFILGRQANVFEDDDGEVKAAGFKMRAEGETAYEPHVCLRMAPQRTEKKGKKIIIHRQQVIAALAEKDRSGILAGKLIEWPNFANVVAPLLGLMGGEQGATPSEEDAATQDAEAQAAAQKEKSRRSTELTERYVARFSLAEDLPALKALAAELTPALKKEFTSIDLAAVRMAWSAKETQLKGLRPTRDVGDEPEEAA